MPYLYTIRKGHKAGTNQGKLLATCCINSGGRPRNCKKCVRCSEKIVDNKTGKTRRCKLSSCKDSRFCWIHLKKKKHVVIKQSTLGDFLGLFAYDKTKPPAPIFKKNTKIVQYGGIVVSPNYINKYYHYTDNNGNLITNTTMPYGLRIGKNTIDAACLRNAGAYCNSAYKIPGAKNNAKISGKFIVATKNIYHDDEILVSYGKSYWKGTSDTYIIQNQRYIAPKIKKHGSIHNKQHLGRMYKKFAKKK